MSSSLRTFNDHRCILQEKKSSDCVRIVLSLLVPCYSSLLQFPPSITFNTRLFHLFFFRPLVLVSVKYPDVATASVLEVWTTRYDQWAENAPLGVMPPVRMNVLVVDVQGMDLEVKEDHVFHSCGGTR